MKATRILAFAAALAISAMPLTACGKKNPSSGSSAAESSAEQTEKDEIKEIRDISSWELVKEIKVGWNLGNTMDANGASGVDAETSWGNPTTSKQMIDLLKSSGFNLLRLPVTWDGHMDENNNYQVEKEWMDRVHEIVDYAIDNDMFVILNTHHEEWYFPTEENKQQDIEQLTALWQQIAEEFKGYDEHLIFEGVNEPRLRGTAQEWTGGDETSRAIVNEYVKAFYDTVRNSGGNNAKRHLMLTGYAASSMASCLEAIDIPEGDDKVIISVHAYLPYSFALDTKGTDQFDPDQNMGEVNSLFNTLDELFLSKNIPVIVGEFGAMNKNNNTEERVEWVKCYLEAAKAAGVPCVWWDNGSFIGAGENFGLMDRYMPPAWKFPEIVDAIMEVYK